MSTITIHDTEIVDPRTTPRMGPADYELVAGAFLTSYRNANTRNNYRQALKVWFAWCLERDMDPLRDIKRAHVEFWLRGMEEGEGLAPRTITGRLNALAGYYKTAVMDGWLPGSPMQFVRRPRVERKTTSNYLTGPELMRVIDLASHKLVRDEAIFCLLGWNGLRVGELVGINVPDVRTERGITTVTITRKGGNTQTLPLAPRSSFAVKQVIGDRDQGPLFTSCRTPGRRLERGDVQRLVKRYAKAVGITKRISPHSFRHSFVTLSLNAHIPQREVQRSAGHADSRMTAYYDHGSQNLMNDPTFMLSAHVEGMI